jgi:FkbH-like protein
MEVCGAIHGKTMKTKEKRHALKEIRELAKARNVAEAFGRLKAISDPFDSFMLQSQYARIFQSLDHDELRLSPIRIALLGSSTLEHFSDFFGYWLALEGMSLDLYISPYDTIRQTILDSNSDLYSFAPDVVWIFSNHRDIRIGADLGEPPEIVDRAVQAAVQEIRSLWDVVRSRSSTFIVQNNADLPAERVFGNMEGSTVWGRANMLRRFNLELANVLSPGVTLFDLDHISSLFGKHGWCDHRYWFHSKHAFSLEASGLVAFHAAKLVGSIKGTAKKCIVLDLDNTLWGGVIGDDGLDGIRLGDGADGEAFVAFQGFLKSLSERGVILAVCSKNDEDTAKEPFLRHPEMRLKLDDISVFRANWDNKPDNILEIADTLNIGLDSLVFVDDNPFERDLVRLMLPSVTVPEMPEDPADYVTAIDRLRLFETISFSAEDKHRGLMYKDNALRQAHSKKFEDLSGYLESLEMEATVGPLDSFHLRRMSQLINKSNQFHLTGTRYSESELETLNSDSKHIIRYFKLKDKFGDNGLISVVILRRDMDCAIIDTWVMSCRVLSRGMEEFITREILSLARKTGCRRVMGRYVPSKKNQLVAGLFDRLGYERSGEGEGGTTQWELEPDEECPEHRVFIRRAEAESQGSTKHD